MKHISSNKKRRGLQRITSTSLKQILEGVASKKEIEEMRKGLIAYSVNVLGLSQEEAEASGAAAVAAHYQAAADLKGASRGFKTHRRKVQ